MKDATFETEFLRHVLASGAGLEDTPDRFQHDSTGAVIFQQSWWHSAFAAALPGIGLRHIKPNDICMDLAVDVKTELYRRHYGIGDNYRVHEAIMPGTRVTFRALVADHVTESNLAVLLDRVGRFIGLSPYGHRLGYGKFRIISLTIAPSDAKKKEVTNGQAIESGNA